MMNTMGWRPKGLGVLFIAVLLSLVAMAGCGSGNKGEGNKSPSAANTQSAQTTQAGSAAKETVKTEPMKLSIMNIFFEAEPPKADNIFIKEIEKYTNTKLDITWVPNTAYADKVNATIASGNMPQVLVVTLDKSPAIINAERSGMFWEIGPLLKDYPNLSKLNEKVLHNISVDGKIYGIYRARPLVRHGLIIRKDWLDQLGLSQPTTVDEMYNVAKAFTLNDPDGNQKNDTYGASETKYLNIFNVFLIALGGPNGWGELDGKLMPDFLFPQYMDALKMVRKMYNEKMINQDFPVVQAAAAEINKGKAGMYYGVLDDVDNRFTDLYKLDPKAELDLIQPFNGPKGLRVAATIGYSGLFMFPKTSVKTEEDLKKILGFFDKLGDDEMYNLLRWGIEGTHYSMVDGKPVVSEAQGDLRTADMGSVGQLKWDQDVTEKVGGKMVGEKPPLVAKYNKMYADNEKYAVTNPAYPLLSETNIEKGSELKKITDDAKIKFILGTIDEAGWNAAIEQWRKGGGDQIIEEYTAAYNQSK